MWGQKWKGSLENKNILKRTADSQIKEERKINFFYFRHPTFDLEISSLSICLLIFSLFIIFSRRGKCVFFHNL